MVRQIMKGDQLIAIHIPASYTEPGVNFLTDESATIQLGVLAHGGGKIIASHMHRPVRRESNLTQEVLVIRKGRIRVDFYDNDDEYLESRILGQGDVILLVSGGHGFEVLEDVDMIEVKTGPYVADDDKRIFQARLPDELKFPD